jgi:hypothetical protein
MDKVSNAAARDLRLNPGENSAKASWEARWRALRHVVRRSFGFTKLHSSLLAEHPASALRGHAGS